MKHQHHEREVNGLYSNVPSEYLPYEMQHQKYVSLQMVPKY